MQNDNWFLNLKHLHYIKTSDFERDLNTRNIHKKSIVFIDEGKLIWTHGKFYQCDTSSWDTVLSFILALNFEPTTNEDGSTTYRLKGKDASGNELSTDASFTFSKDIFVESAELIDDGKTLKVTMSNGEEVNIDLTKLFQLNDFVSTDSIEFILTPDPEDPNKNTIIKAFAKRLLNTAEDPTVTVTVDDNGVFIVGGENSTLSINNDGISIEGKSIDLKSNEGDINIEAPENKSVKINSPLYLSEDYPDINDAITKIEKAVDVNEVVIAAALNDLNSTKVDVISVNGVANKETAVDDVVASVTIDGGDIALTGYTKPESSNAITATDTINNAIGKLEKGLETAVAGSVNSVTGEGVISVNNTDSNNPVVNLTVAASNGSDVSGSALTNPISISNNDELAFAESLDAGYYAV